jgi:23S rRNA pseudouridine2604 synthase
MTDPVRLSRRVAELVGCTRAEAEQYIRNGWVSVDGEVVELPQHRVTGERVVLAEGAKLEPVEPATVLLHKPAGYDWTRTAALVTPATRWPHDPANVRVLQRHFHRLTPLVALDVLASGLVVLTQDGRVVRRLTEDAAGIEHEYLVEVEGDLAPYGLQRLAHGLSFEGRELPPCKVSWQNETRLRFAIKDPREGQLRAMCAQVGLAVVSMRRLRIGRVPLGRDPSTPGPEGAMPPGQWRYLPAGEKI